MEIETAFQELTRDFNSEINGLGYPKAALFGFCVALVTYNILLSNEGSNAERSWSRSRRKIRYQDIILLTKYQAQRLEWRLQFQGAAWKQFRDMPTSQMVKFLIELAGMMKLRKYKKHSRGPKKKVIKKKFDKNVPHVSTAKILAMRTK